MINQEQALRTWLERWRTLKAWKRDLSPVTVELSKRQPMTRLGTCWTYEQRIVIYDAPLESQLATLVHELAHAANIGAAHDLPWQETWAAAVTEITGIAVVPSGDNYRIVNNAGRDAMLVWWKLSGNAMLWRLARGGRAS